MLTETALQHFKTQAAIARTLEISPAAVSKWGDIVPLESATALEIRTRGEVKVDMSLYPNLARAIEVSQEGGAMRAAS